MNDYTTKIIIYGCFGRMGTAISNLVIDMPDIEVVAGFDVVRSRETRSYPVSYNINDYPMPADVVLNFLPTSETEASIALLQYCADKKMPMVIGTTNLPHIVLEAIASVSKKIAIFQAPNLAIGVNLFANIIENAAKQLFDAGFDIEIVEKHHNKKLDAPSGTAIMLSETINRTLGGNMHMQTDRSFQQGERERIEMGIHSIRGGSITGEHSVIFAGHGETIEFTHRAESRDVFALGAIKAAQFIQGKPAGMYNMKDLLNA